MDSIRNAAEPRRAGPGRVADERLVPSFRSAFNGLADHLTSERRSLDSFLDRELIECSAPVPPR